MVRKKWFAMTKTTTGQYVQDLASVEANQLDRAGGKAANLGEMLKAGLPVPGGFVVLTEAYRRCFAVNDPDGCLRGRLDQAAMDGTDGAISSEARDLFLNGAMPLELENEILEAYKRLGRPVTAVRSSANAEDLPGASFAGQYSSFLNVRGEAELMKAVRECWASLWNDRAVTYRRKHGIGNRDLAHGVLVQRLIPAEKSGILFTANPVNGRRDQLLLNASWGLGEAIVGGEVTPDQWVVSKADGAVLESFVARKEVMTIREDGGIRLVSVPAEQIETSTLDTGEVQALARLALQAEGHFGTPQDIEWAFFAGEFHLVQSRPITALYPMPEPRPGRDGLRVHMNVNLYSQAMPEPFTPMGVDLIREMAKDLIRRLGRKDPEAEETLWWFQNIGGRIFVDLTEMLRDPRRWRRLTENDNDKDPVTTRALVQWLERNRGEITSRRGPTLLRCLNFRLFRYLMGAVLKVGVGKWSADRGREKAQERGESMIRRLREDSRRLATVEERLAFIQSTIGEVFTGGFEIVFYVSASSTYIKRARKILAACGGDPSDLEPVEKAVPHSVTTEMGLAILEVARALDARATKAAADAPEVQEFLARYGHRNSVELDVGVPSWSEDPSYVVDLVNGYLEAGTYREALQRFEDARSEAEATIVRLRDNLVRSGHSRQAKKLERLLRDFRAMFGVRELSKFYLRHAMTVYREQLLAVGAALVTQGRLDRPEDVFFVDMARIRSGEELASYVGRIREEFRLDQLRTAPRLITSTGESLYAAASDGEEGGLRGIPVSPGVHEGPVKVLLHPEEGDRLEKGDILVATGTNPAWTPLFLKLGALIMETGGPISHGSVVAREYGVPAVAGVVNATSQLQEGQMVRVNGETGSVEILDGS
ncbi:MAG: hypothetical protein EA424_26885 [Planctomycetaceae bacterium]|nr:MAG: hypothetical protein EA424_26885 [Planctomycetaceae bacterium]